VRLSLEKLYCLLVVISRTDAVINPSSEKFVSPIRLQAPDISINLGDLVDSSTVYNSLSSGGEVRKNIRKFVAVESMGEKLDGELRIWTLV
jgi:hypothetical protein